MVTVPVASVDRAKAFYVDQFGFDTEQDVRINDDHRFADAGAGRCAHAARRLSE
jgi:hypothetical protein